MDNKVQHIPVMYREVEKFLKISPGMTIVDCTLGLGGHAKLILSQLGPRGRYIAIDRDKESLRLAKDNLKSFAQQCEFVHDDFRSIDKILDRLEIKEVDAMVFDLGISSYQLSSPERGFSFNEDGPLDMRMDQDSYISAYDLLNSLSEKEISSIIKDYGEERWHNRIARNIVAKRPIESTYELREIVLRSIPAQNRRQRIHPATRTFQAIRIAVNRELESIKVALEKSVNYLKMGGRICIISFHSLEDRIVKQIFRKYSQEEKVCLVIKKPLRPTDEEVQQNPRSRSARLRVAERIYRLP